MFTIGLTGGIGVGKTQVSQLLADLGVEIVNADLLGHEVYQPGTEGWRAVVDAFGDGVVAQDGAIDRKALGGIVFSDPRQLERLNAIMHPRIYALAEAKLSALAARGVRAAVLEAALLIEAQWTPLVQEVWVIASDEDAVIRRLRERGLDEDAARARINSQMPQSERIAHAHAVIDNNGSLEDLAGKIQTLWNERALVPR